MSFSQRYKSGQLSKQKKGKINQTWTEPSILWFVVAAKTGKENCSPSCPQKAVGATPTGNGEGLGGSASWTRYSAVGSTIQLAVNGLKI